MSKMHAISPKITTSSGYSEMSSTPSDDIFHHVDNSHLLRARVTELERRVVEQEDELTYMRQSMSDLLRRMTEIEAQPRRFKARGTPVSSALSSQHLTPRSQSHQPPADRSPNLSSSNKDISIDNDPNRRRYNKRTASIMSRDLSTPKMSPAVDKWVSRSEMAKNFSNTLRTDYKNRPITPSLIDTTRYRRSGSNLSQAASIRSISNMGISHDTIFLEDEGILQLPTRSGNKIHLYAPENYRPDDQAEECMEPESDLKVDWIYGYRGKDCRNNIHTLPSGELLYNCGKAVIAHDYKNSKQRFYLKHNSDVRCLIVHPNHMLIASGQGAVKEGKSSTAPIHIYDVINLATVRLLHAHQKSVVALAFSQADLGAKLASIDGNQNLILWSWEKGDVLTDIRTGADPVLCLSFHPQLRHCLIAIGRGHSHIWTHNVRTRQLDKLICQFEGRDKPKYVLCLAFSELGDLITGDSQGALTMWDVQSGRAVKHICNAHDGPIFSVLALGDGKLLSGGGRDGCIRQWISMDLRMTGKQIKLAADLGHVRQLCQISGDVVAVGTTFNAIIAGNIDENFRHVIVEPIAADASVSINRSNTIEYCIGQEDALLKIFARNQLQYSLTMEESITALDHHQSKALIAVGMNLGKFAVVDLIKKETISVTRLAPPCKLSAISALRWSHADQIIISTKDSHIFVYAIEIDAAVYTGPIMRDSIEAPTDKLIKFIEWSSDDEHMRLTAYDNEQFYYSTQPQISMLHSSKIIRRLQFSNSRQNTLTFELGGVIENENEDELYADDIGAACIVGNDAYISINAPRPELRIYPYPCRGKMERRPKSLENSIHSAPISKIFNIDDRYILTHSCGDCCLCLWSINRRSSTNRKTASIGVEESIV